MTIEIRSLTFDTIIGILDHERVTPQRISVDCEIDYDFSGAFINYAEIAEMIKTEMRNGQFELIEEALIHLKRFLREKHPAISTLTLRISKPDILPDCTVSVSETFNF